MLRAQIWALVKAQAAQTTPHFAANSCQQQQPPALIVTSLISMQAYLRRDAGVAVHGRLASGRHTWRRKSTVFSRWYCC